MKHLLRLSLLVTIALNIAALSFGHKETAAAPVAPAPASVVVAVVRSVSTVSPLLAAFDADRDGKLSAAEIANATHLLRMLDANGDGELTAGELPAPAAGH